MQSSTATTDDDSGADISYSLTGLTDSLGFLTRVVHVQLNEKTRGSRGNQLSPSVVTLLACIDANPGIRQVEAARLMVIQESNMATLIKRCIDSGLIDRVGPGRRRDGLCVTARGKEELVARKQGEEIERGLALSLSDKDYQKLLDLLSDVYLSNI